MECEEFLRDYSDFLDHRFEEHPIVSYCDHLLGCSDCAEYDRVMRRGLELLRRLERPETQAGLVPRVSERVLGSGPGRRAERERTVLVAAAAAPVMRADLLRNSRRVGCLVMRFVLLLELAFLLIELYVLGMAHRRRFATNGRHGTPKTPFFPVFSCCMTFRMSHKHPPAQSPLSPSDARPASLSPLEPTQATPPAA